MAPSLRWALLAGPALATLVRGSQWPYTREFTNRSTPVDEINEIIPNYFVRWLVSSLEHSDVSNPSGGLNEAFYIPEDRDLSEVQSTDDLYDLIASQNVKPGQLPRTIWDAVPVERQRNFSEIDHARMLFANLDYEIEEECISKKENYWYRTANGACNWLRKGESYLGSTFQPRSRDFGQHSYADGISEPRAGPNPREISNAFFRRKERLHYEHTPLMLGLVEWIMHDVSYSEDAVGPHTPGEVSFEGPPAPAEYIDVPIPAGDEAFDPDGHGNRTFRVWRTKPAAGTGTSKANPREHENGATAWLDGSALYGSTEEVGRMLRSLQDGKLKAEIGADGREYLPFNTGPNPLAMRTRPGINMSDLFMGGDPRTSEDWILLSVHTLLLREHNRLCDILRAQHPDWEDEQLYQTARLVMGSKIALIGNSYQMAYWNEDMPWPRDDGFPLYRAMYGATALEINPVHAYPWPLVTRNDRPMVTSAEMAVVYRFHEFIINNFNLTDEHNRTIEDKTIFSTGFDSRGFFKHGADPVLRGMLATDIPNFKSGVDETFRSAGKYRGEPLDLVVWSIVHEREQGLPTFNDYWRGYAAMEPPPAVSVKVREKFEDFTSDPEALRELKRLYKTPDDVDFVVGVQLEEELFPGTTMPVSALIPSLFSLFGVGNSDRFSPGFAVMRCILVDKPWDCHPSNALEDLLWKPQPKELFPNFRWFDTFWMKELDFQAHGTNLLFRLITENSGARCIQKNPLFPFDPVTNPVLCEPEPPTGGGPSLKDILELFTLENLIKYIRSPFIPWKAIFNALHISWKTVLTALAGLVALVVAADHLKRILPRAPPINWGDTIVGVGQALQNSPKDFILSQQTVFGKGKTFGLRLIASTIYFIAGNGADLDVMKNDEYRASFNTLSDETQLGSIVGRRNLKEELHAALIRQYLEDKRDTSLPTLSDTVTNVVRGWLDKNSLAGSNVESLQDKLFDLMAHVMSASVSGPERYDNPELIEAYKGLNKASTTIFGASNLMPSWLAVTFSTLYTLPYWIKIKRILGPVIHNRRGAVAQRPKDPPEPLTDLLSIFVRATDSDSRVAELVGGIVIGGLINVASGLNNALYDAVSAPARQRLQPVPLDPQTFWHTPLHVKAAVFESLRLSACIFGPVRKIVTKGFKLASDNSQVLPKNSYPAAPAHLVHYDDTNYDDASSYQPQRFATGDPLMGTSKYLTFGLPGHTCPGRFFAVEAVAIALNEILARYHIEPVGANVGREGYNYRVGDVVMVRKPFTVNVRAK